MTKKVRTCSSCGSTDARACEGGCTWSERDPKICTSCEAERDIISAICLRARRREPIRAYDEVAYAASPAWRWTA